MLDSYGTTVFTENVYCNRPQTLFNNLAFRSTQFALEVCILYNRQECSTGEKKIIPDDSD